ncbi:MAG: flagellar biosynthesis protein FlgN [Gammaproteobacteria bacterium]|nr:MAG: flagellar biosynthesis protein FlgN [Gammaproteobacteria bacterium]
MAMTSFQQMRSILIAEKETAMQLLSLLEGERDALTKSDSAMIDASTAKKQPLVVKLEKLGRQREMVLASEGFSSGKEGLEAFIENQTGQNATGLTNIVSSLKIIAKACKTHNQINGGIVNVNRQHLQRAMNLLRGRESHPTSYGPGGEYSSQVVRQPLLGRV